MGAAAVVGLWCGLPQGAAAQAPSLLTDPGLAYLSQAAPKTQSATWREAPDPAAALCAAAGGPVGRAALMTRPPTRFELDRCRSTLGREPEVVVIGYEAVAVVGKLGDALIPLDAGRVFRALAREVASADGSLVPNAAKQWSDIDPSLPAVAIAMLVPPPSSAAWRIFATTVMDQGCLLALGTRVPFDARRRAETCGGLRGDGAVTTVEADTDRLGRLAGAPSGTLAVVPQAALRSASVEVNVMPVGGHLPTAATVAAGGYPGARSIYLSYVVPRQGAAAAKQAPRPLGEALIGLLGEDSIGPYGAVAAAGLVPLIPAERVALRERVADELGGAP